jgi:hypothetical protein
MAARPSRLRLLAVILVGPLALALLFLAFVLYYRWAQSGITGWLADAMSIAPIRLFGRNYVLRILLPLYTLAGIALWLLTLAPLWLLDRPWARAWRARECLALGLAAFLWAHVCLWWQVPTALWTLPGLGRLPFVVLFPLLGAMPVAIALYALRRRGWRWPKAILGLALWLLLWAVPGWLPQVLPAPGVTPRGGSAPCRVLLVGLDGLRSDVFLAKAGDLKGLRYENAYTPIPATRLLWHILWGGDPLFYTVGHVGPSIEEYQHPESLALLKEAKEQDWKPRFYIDDGGTVGLAERQTDLDDALSPAEGWENFVNSNLASSFPLYAVWENWFKPFPTTNPWAPLDAGLKEALRLGRGSKWVMFHSCLAHQPIFLTRDELAQTGRWWTLSPSDYKPVADKRLVLKSQAEHPDPRTNTFLAYRIRMDAILRAWQPIWNRLDQDPAYRGAVRVLFSDHGERFHNIGPNGFQLQGIHGFNLDAWECRTAMLVAGPGFSEQVETKPRATSVSLLGLRDGTRRLIQGKGPFDAGFFESAYPTAPIRYHTLDDSAFGTPEGNYRQMTDKEIASHSFIGPHGLWYTQYEKPASERAKDVSLGLARGADLWIYKPLVDGGAHEIHYRGYQLESLKKVEESVYQAKKAQVEALMPPLVRMVENAKATPADKGKAVKAP